MAELDIRYAARPHFPTLTGWLTRNFDSASINFIHSCGEILPFSSISIRSSSCLTSPSPGAKFILRLRSCCLLRDRSPQHGPACDRDSDDHDKPCDVRSPQHGLTTVLPRFQTVSQAARVTGFLRSGSSSRVLTRTESQTHPITDRTRLTLLA